jgi:phospholipid transport system transporter-binding protein
MKNIRFEKNNNVIVCDGQLTITNISKGIEKTLVKLLEAKVTEIDLAKVTKFDTAGLALLLLAIEKSQSLNTKITFTNVSEEIHKLAKLSGVDSFLLD